MKHLISILILSFCLQSASYARTHSVNDNQLVTQLKVVENDSTFWYMYVYDAGKKVIETKSFRVDSTTWIRKSLTEWIYEGDNCISLRERVWRGYWDFTYTIDYTYLNGILQTETHSTYTNGISSAVQKSYFSYNQNLLSTRKDYTKNQYGWHLSTLTDFKYNSDNKTDSVIISSFQADTLDSKLISLFNYTDNLLSSQLVKQYSSNGWVNSDSIYWFYFPNTSLVKTQKNKKWNKLISNWENFQRIDYEYNDSNNILSETYQHWATMFWENDVKYDYSYINNTILLKKTLLLPIYEEWRQSTSINYTDINDSKANTIRSTYEFWGGKTGELTTSFIPYIFNDELLIRRAKSIQLSYTLYNDTILQNNHPELLNIDIYPNPSNGIFYINTHDKYLKSWVISDLNGRILKHYDQAFQSSVVDITNLPKGIYVLKVLTNDSSTSAKIIRQ